MKDETKVILITGALGQDGYYLAEYLASHYEKVKVYCGFRYSATRILGITSRGHKNINISNSIFIELDVTDHTSIASAFNSILTRHGHLDQVYHLAAFSHVGKSYQHVETVFQTNTIGTANMLEAIKRFTPETKFYNACTSEMFDGSSKELLTEEDAFKPKSPYGISKLASFNLGNYYKEAYGLFVSQGILFNHESPRRGPDFVTQKIVTSLVRQYYYDDAPILELGSLISERDWGDARDYVKGMVLMLEHDEPDNFILATGKSISVLDFLKKAHFMIFGDNDDLSKRYISTDKNKRANEVFYLKGDSTKARKILHWEPEYTIDNTIKFMITSAAKSIADKDTNYMNMYFDLNIKLKN